MADMKTIERRLSKPLRGNTSSDIVVDKDPMDRIRAQAKLMVENARKDRTDWKTDPRFQVEQPQKKTRVTPPTPPPTIKPIANDDIVENKKLEESWGLSDSKDIIKTQDQIDYEKSHGITPDLPSTDNRTSALVNQFKNTPILNTDVKPLNMSYNKTQQFKRVKLDNSRVNIA